jgi:tRNA G26 N,N-dimethylase Trm1
VYQLARSGTKLKIQSRKVHNGISRVVWKASLVMAQYIEDIRYNEATPKGQEALQFLKKEHNTSEYKILELGSGTGLGGFFSQIQLNAKEICMTDICPQSINLIKENIQLNKESFHHNIKSFSVNFLEWGKHDIT